MMNEEDVKLIIDATIGAIPKEKVLERYSYLGVEPSKIELQLLQNALNDRDADGVECALLVGGLFGTSIESSAVLRELALAEWHQRHEDVVTALDQLNDPDSVATLYEVAIKRFAYRCYDEAQSLAVKAIWALARIAGREAEKALTTLSHSENRIVCEEARRQLQRLRGSD